MKKNNNNKSDSELIQTTIKLNIKIKRMRTNIFSFNSLIITEDKLRSHFLAKEKYLSLNIIL